MTDTPFLDLLRAHHAAHPQYMGSAPSQLVHAGHMADIKEAARRALYWIQPQTRLELVARSLGYHSQAALAAALATATPERPLPIQMSTGPRSDLHAKVFAHAIDSPLFPWEKPADPAFRVAVDGHTIDQYNLAEARSVRVMGIMATGFLFLTHLHNLWRKRDTDPLRAPSPNEIEGSPVSGLHRTVYVHDTVPGLVRVLKDTGADLLGCGTPALAPLHLLLPYLAASPVSLDAGRPLYIPNHLAQVRGAVADNAHGARAMGAGCAHHVPLAHAVFDVDAKGIPSVHHHGWERDAPHRFGACDPEWASMDTIGRVQAARSQIHLWTTHGVLDHHMARAMLEAVHEIRADTEIRNALHIWSDRDALFPAYLFPTHTVDTAEDTGHADDAPHPHTANALSAQRPSALGQAPHWREVALAQHVQSLGDRAWHQTPARAPARDTWIAALARSTVFHPTNKDSDAYWHQRAGHLLEAMLLTQALLGGVAAGWFSTTEAPQAEGAKGDGLDETAPDAGGQRQDGTAQTTLHLSTPSELLDNVLPYLRSGVVETDTIPHAQDGGARRRSYWPGTGGHMDGVRILLARLKKQDDQTLRPLGQRQDGDTPARRRAILFWEQMLRTPNRTRDSVVETLAEHLHRITRTSPQEQPS